MPNLLETIIDPDHDAQMGPILWTITVICQFCMLAGHIFLLCSIAIILVPIVLMVLLMIIDGVFGTHWFESFNAVISST